MSYLPHSTISSAKISVKIVIPISVSQHTLYHSLFRLPDINHKQEGRKMFINPPTAKPTHPLLGTYSSSLTTLNNKSIHATTTSCQSPLSSTSPSFRPFLTPPSSFPPSPIDSSTSSLLISGHGPTTSWAPLDPPASPYAPVSLMLPLDPATSNIIVIPNLYQFRTLLIPLPTFSASWSPPSSNWTSCTSKTCPPFPYHRPISTASAYSSSSHIPCCSFSFPCSSQQPFHNPISST